MRGSNSASAGPTELLGLKFEGNSRLILFCSVSFHYIGSDSTFIGTTLLKTYKLSEF